MDSPALSGSGKSSPAVFKQNDPQLPGRAERDRRRLTRRIIGGAVIVALAIIGLTTSMLWHLQNTQLDNGLNNISTLDLLVASQTERAFESVGVVLDDISADLQSASIASPAMLRQAASDETTFRLLRAKMAGIPQLDALAIATSEGDVVNRSRSYPVNQKTNLAGREYFARLRDHPEISAYISPPLQGADGQMMVFIGKRLTAPNGAFIGIVLGAIHVSYFDDLYANYLGALPGSDKSLAMWRNDGTLLSRFPAEPVPVVDGTATNFTLPMPRSGLLSYWTKNQQGGTIAIAQHRLDNFPLVVEVRQSAAAMLVPWDSEFLAAGFGGGALLLLVGIAVWLLLRQLKTQALIIEERARANREAEAREDIERARENAETAMRDAQHSETRFRDIAEVGSDWIWETDAEHRFTTIAGARQPKVSLIGRTRWEQAGVETETDPLWRDHKAVLDARQPFRQFRFAIELPGGRFHVCVSGKPIFADDGSFLGYRGTVSDETELIETRERAMRADALLSNAIESIAEGFVIYDAEDRFVMCNEAYRTMYKENSESMLPGVTYEEVMRAAVATGRYAIAIGREEEWLANWMHKHRNPGEAEESQLADGRWVLRSERRMPDGSTAGLRIDITPLKRVQQSLRDSQQRFDRTQRIAHIGTVERDLITRSVVWSEETYRIFGVTPEAHTPSFENRFSFVHPDDREQVQRMFRLSEDQQRNTSLKYRIIRPTGEIRTVFCQADTTYSETDKPLFISIAMMDITEKEQASQRQIELEMQLRHSEKLTALGTLAGGIAHDLNNTLVPIQALSKLAMQEFQADTPTRGDLETIHNASLQARDLVRQILAFSRKQETMRAPTDVAVRVREALQMLRASVPSTIEIVENVAPIAPISADGTQLQQIVVNLVTNGAYAIGNNYGRVTVTLDELPSALDTSRMIRLSIADTGCGMSPEIMHRMFEPFFTTKSVGEGTGLGLSVVHGIVTSLGGTIGAQSLPGEGTEFTVTLPVKSIEDIANIAAVA